jgi:uncharacterized membrane protein
MQRLIAELRNSGIADESVLAAIASILLIKGFLEQNGIIVEPLQLSIWAIPTAIAALLIHSFRLWLLDRRLKRVLEARPAHSEVTP